LSNVAVLPVALKTHVKVVFVVVVTTNEALALNVVPPVLAKPTDLVSAAVTVAPPLAVKLMKQPWPLLLFRHVVVSVTTTVCAPVTTTLGAVPVVGAAYVVLVEVCGPVELT
jgi:hypothetical protein